MAVPTQQYFKELGKDLSPAFRAPFQYFFAYTHFALRQYDQALDFLTPLIQQVEWMFKHELFRFARLLQLIIHWERGDFELLPSLLRSTRRYLHKTGGTFVLEDRLLKFLSKAPHTNLREAFKQLNADLSAGPSEVLSPQVLHHFHFLCWVESHLKKRSFAEVYREFTA